MSGWDDPDRCRLSALVYAMRRKATAHPEELDPVDVGNYAMMIFNRNERGT